jgi:hypothetical protein
MVNRFTKALASEARWHLSCQEMITDIKSFRLLNLSAWFDSLSA